MSEHILSGIFLRVLVQDPEVLWRLGRAYVKRCEEGDVDAATKLALLEKATDVMERARSAPGGDTSFKTAMYSGIVLNAKAECLGTKAQLECSPACKNAFLISCCLLFVALLFCDSHRFKNRIHFFF